MINILKDTIWKEKANILRLQLNIHNLHAVNLDLTAKRSESFSVSIQW